MSALVVVTLPKVSGFAEDAVQNSFAISGLGPADVGTKTGPLSLAIGNFYNAATGGGNTIREALSNGVSRAAAACTIDCYDITTKLDGSPHGSPFWSSTFTLGAGYAGAAMPSEVSLAMTLRGSLWDSMPVESADGSDPDSAVDRPRQRRTGKLYIGPLNFATTNDSSVDDESRPGTGVRTALLDAAERFHDLLAADGMTWCVWSRKNAGLYPVVRVEVDNAWDTQRRRGPDATSRSARTIDP